VVDNLVGHCDGRLALILALSLERGSEVENLDAAIADPTFHHDLGNVLVVHAPDPILTPEIA
jgi:hypothetical protein